MEKFYVQETIGGWKQTPSFKGTYEECVQYLNDYCNDSRSSFTIISPSLTGKIIFHKFSGCFV